MHALRMHERGGLEGLVYEEAPVPEPGTGDVLVRVHAGHLGLMARWTDDHRWVAVAGFPPGPARCCPAEPLAHPPYAARDHPPVLKVASLFVHPAGEESKHRGRQVAGLEGFLQGRCFLDLPSEPRTALHTRTHGPVTITAETNEREVSHNRSPGLSRR